MRTQINLDALVQQLQLNCGDVLAACRAIGVSLIFVNQWRKDDAKVNEALLEAERVGTQGLVSAAITRAVQGVQEGIYYKGEVVGYKTNYSDSLLTTLLKAKVPEFAKDGEGSGVQVNVQIANIMPRATDYAGWLAMKDQTMNRALPAPSEDVIDAEFVEREASLEAISRIMCEPPPFAGIEL